jgi:hypothetical protein
VLDPHGCVIQNFPVDHGGEAAVEVVVYHVVVL